MFMRTKVFDRIGRCENCFKMITTRLMIPNNFVRECLSIKQLPSFT